MKGIGKWLGIAYLTMCGIGTPVHTKNMDQRERKMDQTEKIDSNNFKTKEKISYIFDNNIADLRGTCNKDIFALFVTVDEDGMRYNAAEKGRTWIEEMTGNTSTIIGVDADEMNEGDGLEKIDNFFQKVEQEASDEDRIVVYVEGHGKENMFSSKYSVGGKVRSECLDNLFANLSCSTNLLVISSCGSGIFGEVVSGKDNLVVMTSSNDEHITIGNLDSKKFYGYHVFDTFYKFPELPLERIFEKSRKAYIGSNRDFTPGVDFSYPALRMENKKLQKEVF